jgi:hypothetical protein
VRLGKGSLKHLSGGGGDQPAGAEMVGEEEEEEGEGEAARAEASPLLLGFRGGDARWLRPEEAKVRERRKR